LVSASERPSTWTAILSAWYALSASGITSP
jgi:hypothetical protein